MTNGANRPARTLNPRRAALAELRTLARWLRHMIRVWNQDQTVYDDQGGPDPETGSWQVKHRPLRAEEKRENQPERWAELARYAEGIAGLADALAVFAREQKALAERRAATPTSTTEGQA